MTLTEQTETTDHILLSGTASRVVELNIAPVSTTVTPFQSAQFQLDVFSNANDNYYLSVSGPEGWFVQVNDTGETVIRPGVNVAQPDNYTFQVIAQSYSQPELVVTGEFIVTIIPYNGINLDVVEESLITVPWGPGNPNALPGDNNNGQVQLPDAAYTINITNTSTVSHTFDVSVSGLPDGWLLLSGAEGQTMTALTLPAGGVGQVGLYISPTVTALPPAGTPYPFTVTAVDTDGAGLSQSDSDTFTVPAIAFNQVTAVPALIFASPATTATFDINLSNVGNIAGSFPLTVTLPLTTWVPIFGLQSPVPVDAGETVTQAFGFNVPADAPLGRTYPIRLDSPAPGTAYVQTTFAQVQIVSANALPIYRAAQEIGELFPDAADVLAGLNFLALSIDDLEQSCQQGVCDLVLRDRVASGADALAQAVAPLSPFVTADSSLDQLAAIIPTHTAAPDLLADNNSLRNVIGQLQTELRDIAHHDLQAAFTPGLQTTLDNRAARYDLVVTNEGSEPTTAVLTLTPPAAATVNWSSQSTLLQPGETITVSTIVTPTVLGAYILRVDMGAAEASLIQHEVVAGLGVVDALLRISSVDVLPTYVEYNSSVSAAVQATIANVANAPLNGDAIVQVFDAVGVEVYATTPTPITFDSALIPLGYHVGSIDTTGLVTGTYTVTVRIVDADGDVIPQAAGQGRLSIAQAVEATARVEPAIVTPGDATVTTVIDTELNQAILNLISETINKVKRIVLGRHHVTSSRYPVVDPSLNALFFSPMIPTASYFSGSDLDGWSMYLGTPVNPGSGGSDGSDDGYLQANPSADSQTSYYVAPDKFHGDWRNVVELRLMLWSSGGTYFTSGYAMYGDIFLANGGQTAQLLLPRRPAPSWDSFTVLFNDTENWVLGGGASSLDAVLSNVTDFQIRAEYGVGADSSGLDSVELFVSEADPDFTTALQLTSTLTETTAGDAFAVTVTAVDALGNVTTNYTGTVTFASSDSQAALPIATTNIARGLPGAQLSVSSQYSASYPPTNAVDGNNGTDWATAGQTSNAWIQLNFTAPVTVDYVILRDRANTTDYITTSQLTFSDGSIVDVGSLPNNGAPKGVFFAARTVEWVRYTILTGGGLNVGLAEFELYPNSYTFTTGSDADNGQHTFTDLVLNSAGVQTITVTDGLTSDSITFNVNPGPVNTAVSGVQVTGPHRADGVDAATIRVTVVDSSGNPIPGADIWALASGEGNVITGSPGVTDANGIFTATLTSTQAEAKALRILAGGGQAMQWLVSSPIVEFTGAVITGTVFADANRDGAHQVDEAGLGGVQVSLYTADGAPLKTTVTPSDGRFTFTGLLSDTYRLEQTRLDQYAFSQNGVLTVSVAAFDTAVNNDFGNYSVAQVSGHVWHDSDQDGVRDLSESAIPGVTLNLLDGSDQLIETTTSGENGAYHFDLAANLPAAPDNFVFNSGRLALHEPATAVIGNAHFSRGQTPLDPVTYPANYDFSTGDLGGWTPSNAAYVAVSDDILGDGSPYLHLSSYNQYADSPTFVVPAEAQSLTFRYHNATWRDSAAARPVYVYILSGEDFTISTQIGSASGSRLQPWQTAVLDIRAFQGQTVKLRFLADTDSYWQGISRLDSIALNIQAPDWTFDNALYTAVISNSLNLDGPYLQIGAYSQSAYSAPFVVPVNAQSLRFNYQNWTWRDSAAARPVHVYILSGEGFATSTQIGSASGSLSQGWGTAVLDVQAFRGQTIKLRFLTDTDSYWQGASRLDNIALYVETPGWTPGDVRLVSIGADLPPLQTETTSPSNADFAQGLTPLDTAAYPHNYNFADGRTPLLPATYPTNYNFSSGDLGDWTPSNATYVTVVDNIYNLDGPYLNLGSYNQAADSPVFTIPAAAQTLRFNYYNQSWRDSNAARPVHVYALSGPDLNTVTLLGSVSGSNLQGWQTAILDVQTFRGQNVKLRFQSDTDSYWQGTARIDNLSLEIETPGWTVSNASLVRVVGDSYSLPDGGSYLSIGSYNQWADTTPFTVPADAQTVRFDYMNTTWRDSNAARPVHVYVYSGANFNVSAHLGSVSGSYLQGWRHGSFDIQAYQGQAIKFRFVADTDGYWQGTSRIDNISLNTQTPGWLPSSTNVINIHGDTPPVNPPDNLENGEFNNGRTPLPTNTYPANYDFSHTRIALASTDYPANYDFSHIRAAADPAAYPANYNFTLGSLGDWTPSNATYVTVVSNTLNYDGHYLLISSYSQYADSPAFTIPADVQSLRFNYQNWSWRDANASRPLHIYILSGNDFATVTQIGSVNGSANNGWLEGILDLQAYQGQTVKLRFRADSDGYWQGTARVDNVTLHTELVDGWKPSTTSYSYVQVVSDTHSFDGPYLRLASYNQYADSPAFIVPEDVQSLRFDYQNWSWRDAAAARPVHVYVISGPDLSITTHLGSANGSANNGWLEGILDLQAFQGQIIKLRFHADTDGYWQGTSRIDNITLHTELVDGWKPSTVSYSYVQVVSDTHSLNGPYLRLASYNQYADSPAFTVPENTQSLRFNYANWTWRDAAASRPVHVYALSGPYLNVATYLGGVNGSLNEGWKTAQLDLQAFQGQTIRLRFQADTDSYWQGTSRVDNISLNIEAPGWDLANASVSSVQANGVNGPYLLLNGYNLAAAAPPFLVPTTVDSLTFDYFNSTWRDAAASRPVHVYAYIGENFAYPIYLGAVSGSLNEGWKQASLSMANVRGRYIKLRFLTDTDGYWQGISRIDSITLVHGVGGAPLGNDYNNSDYIVLGQQSASIDSIPFLVPTNTTGLTFNYLNATWRDGAAARPVHVYALSGAGFGFSTYLGSANGSALTGWNAASLNLSSFQGQTIQLRFQADTDGYWQGVAKVDDIALILTPGSGGGAPPDTHDGSYIFISSHNTRIDSAPFIIPADAQSLRFDHINWSWRDTNASRPLHVYLLTGTDFSTAVYLGAASGSALQGWKEATLNLTAYQGQTVKLRFLTDTDGYWQGTAKIDNVYLLPAATTAYTIAEINPVNYTSSTPDSVSIDAYGGATFTINFGDFAVDRYQSTVAVAPAEVTADGISTAVITITIRDGSGNPLPGYAVEILAPGSDITVHQPLTVTNAAGEAVGSISATHAPQTVMVTARTVNDNVTLAQSVPVTFVPGATDPARSTLVAAPTAVVANGVDTAAFTVSLRDQFDNPVFGHVVNVSVSGTAVTLTQNLPQSDSLGQVSGSIRSSSAQTVTLTAYDATDAITVTQTAVVLFTTADPQQSTVIVTPTSLIADGLTPVTITVTLRDQIGAPLPGKPIHLAITGNDNYLNGQLITGTTFIGLSAVDGVMTAVLTSTATGLRTISALGDGVPLAQQAQVSFVVGPVDAAASRLETDIATVIADGNNYATIVAVLYDHFGHPVAGKDVLIQANGANVTIAQPLLQTNAMGSVQATIQSTAVQTVTVWAINQTDNITLTQTVSLFFVPGPADPGQSTIVISPTSVIADGVQTTTITITLRDALGHPVTQRAVQLVASGSDNIVTPAAQGNTDANGVIRFSLASSAAEIKTISARELAYNVLIPGGQVAFVPGAVDLSASALSADKITIAADGVDTATLTATLHDSYGHPIPGKMVTIQTGGSVTLTQPLTMTDSQGRVQATIQSGEIQSVTVTAVLPTDGLTLSPTITLNFVAGPPDATNSIITVTPTTAVADNNESIAITADLRDAFGRPLSNRTVRLQVSGSNNSVQPGNPVTTDANGHVVFTLASTRAQIKDLTLLDLVSNVTLPLGQVTFVPGPVNADTSIVTATPADVLADGTSQTTVTIRLLDAYNNAVPGVTAVLTSTAPGVLFTQPAAPSDANGNLSGYVASVTPGQAILTVIAGGTHLNDTAAVHFSGPDLVATITGPNGGVVGREVTYTVSIANQGQLLATAVTLTDALPTQMAYVRDNGGFPLSQSGNTLTWQVGDMAVGAALQFQIVALVNPSAPLGGQLTNTIQAGSASLEENMGNNSASATLTVGPGYAYQASVVPAAQTIPIGAYVTYEVVVRNAGNLVDTYHLAINDLNATWYTLEPSVLTLAPGEVGRAMLTIHTANCADAGAYQFFALVTSTGAGNTQTIPSDITLVTTPMIANLLPTTNTAIGATSALFTWQTAVTGTTSLYLRPTGDPTYTEYTGDPGLLHQVTINGLTRNISYEWYASTTSACGHEDSAPRTLQVLNGIVFAPRQYNFAVERDYNQIVAVTVHNQDTISHTVVVSIENPYPELIVGFVDEGSADAPIVLQPGASRTVNLGIHAQDVVQRDFNLVARLTAADRDGAIIEDAVPVNVHVNIPDINFTLEEIGFDAQTLVRTFRLTNLGDPLTDFAVNAVVTGTGSLYLQPAMSHGYLGRNQSFTFEAIPAVDSGFQALTGVIQATAAGVMTYTNASISLPPGTGMYLGEASDVSMEAKTADWYCTNRPVINNRIVLPPGFRRADVVSADFYFNIRSTWTSVRPHDVDIFLNENQIGELVNLIPHGLYTFPIDPSFLNESLYAPSVNYIKLVTSHFNGGHYVVATDMMVSICLSGYREWVAATSQVEADSIVSNRSFLIPAPTMLDIDILEPSAGQTVYTGVPITIKARILDDVVQPLFFNVTVTADNGNGGLILYDDGVHGDGGYRDGVYANTWTPVNAGPTTLTFHAGSCTIAADAHLTLNVQAADFALDVRHHVPITGTAVLTSTASPTPQGTAVSPTETALDWAYTLNGVQPSQQIRFDVTLPGMQPGEIREVSSGTVISYTGPGGGGVIALPPLFVAAPHLVAVSPAAQTVNVGSTASYQVALYNPGPDTAVFTPTVAGLFPNWVQMAGNVTLAAGDQITIPLTIYVPETASIGAQPFAVVVTTATGGQDQAGASLLVVDALNVAVTPATATVFNSKTITYTLTVTNLETIARTYDLSVTGLDASAINLVDQVTVMAGSVVTLPLAITAYESHGPHTFAAQAVNQENGLSRQGDAAMTIVGDRRVQTALTPDTAVAGPGVPLTYTLTVTNSGDLADTYALQVSVPAGWTARLDANGTAVTELALTPHVFNAAHLLLIVTPPPTAAPGDYEFSVSAQSQYNPGVAATANGAATLLSYGVTVQLAPDQTTLVPTETGVWQVTVTNVGSAADSYDLAAGGIVAGSATFSQNPVSLAAGESTTVQMAAGAMEFALAQSYPLEVRATSLYDSRIWNYDAAIVTFSGYAAVDVEWLPQTQVLTDTATATYMLIITNTGNLSTLYNLSVVAPGLAQQLETNQVYIPPHMTAGILVTLRATAAGTYLITGQVDAVAAAASDSSVATLIVEASAVQHPPLAVSDSMTTTEDTAVAISVLANDSDPDGDPLTVIAVTQPLSGTAVINPDNSVTYTPAADVYGQDSFSYTISDGHNGSSTALVTVTITPVNDAPWVVDDIINTPEDTPVTFNALANDSDVEGDALTITALTQPGNGTAVLNADGSITYTPDADFNSNDSASGYDSFTYTVSDNQGASSSGTISILVEPVNDAPALQDDTVTTNEDTAVTIFVLANDSDVDGDDLTVDSVTQPAFGAAAVSPDGSVVYTPTTNYHGADSFTYTVSDGNGGVSQAAVTITVTPVNDAPIAVDDTALTDEDTAVIIFVLDNDTDVDGDVLTVTAVTTPTHGLVTVNPDGSITYTPDADTFGVDSFTYTAGDGHGSMDTATVVVTVTAVNDPPVAVDDEIATAEETPVTVDVLANDSDVDGDTLTLVGVSQPEHGSVTINPDNTLTYTPTLNFSGSDSFTYTVQDGQGGVAAAVVTITVSNENDNPVAVDDMAETLEDTAVTIPVLDNDSDVDGDTLVISSVTQPGHGSVTANADGTLTYTPNENYYGADSFSYTISDGNGGADTAVVSITVTPVNDAPDAVDDTATTNEDTAVTIFVLDNDSDVDGDVLTVTVTITSTRGSVVVNPDNSVTYTPEANLYGVDSFTYTLSDGHGGTDTAVVTLTVMPVNDAPVATNDTAMTDEDTAVTLDVLANDTDVDGDALTLESVTQPDNGVVVARVDGTLTYTPTADYHGADSFTYTISDGQGGMAVGEVTVAVNPVNDKPTALDDAAATLEDTAVTINVLTNDTDVDGDTLTITTVTTPTNGLATINPDNTVTYAPNANFHGLDSFAYTISDGHSEMDTAAVVITVMPVNDAPVARDDGTVTEAETAVTIAVLANDTDVDGDALRVENVTQPLNGTAVINPDQTITYTPAAGFYGDDSFTYTISDGQGGSDTAIVLVTVMTGNHNPEAVDDFIISDEDVTVTIDVLANDTDVDGDALTVVSVTQPSRGVVVINPDSSITYTPNPDSRGPDSFTYTISDGRGGFDTAIVTVLVKNVNDPPVAVDDTATTNRETAVTIPVLANDSDVDNDILFVDSVTQPAHGTAVINPDKTVTYTPEMGFDGLDSFTYTVSDGKGGLATATVTVDVRPIAAGCNLYPIALHADLLAGVQPGDILPDILNGTQPGNFGWLTWTGDNGVPTLLASLTPPGNSHTYINPYNPNDHIISIGDWIVGKPGVSNAKKIRDALDELMQLDIVVPIWTVAQGSGANTRYQVSGFAIVRILGYDLPAQDRITAQFLGYASCDGH